MNIIVSFITAAAATVLIGATQAQAASSIADCEKIEAWDAYNKCLASFGRKQGTLRVRPEGGPADASPRARRGQTARGGGVTRRNGRSYAVFDVGAPVKPSPGRRRRR